jgi:hypothetical protein
MDTYFVEANFKSPGFWVRVTDANGQWHKVGGFSTWREAQGWIDARAREALRATATLLV